ncbi:5-hydroxytryptamine receptor 1 isoform X2 [Nematostella vectensis]|nr:5-hydroxytryptamine receptor 1 isoform X2 [Nematostella vectensis]XP_032238185.1 5-hydroxytryptamine receptor 1 isoform X2 [Nematostella vectensis]XP_032238186.1 5-hydroxytryptamine receptor 1 isoform X2 [Nematostella vectensis]XP_032238187.1 5-hydroxytryptamine receptor 1 isoform X2 [Nematostella vectensis]XP_032238189.1 5-hydroxytryptamine receptor 1 isoform X2 [Nematostella vectensis]XP_032238190.1 5-hydroxytryptamine receptor 1 isoform X2 [Nematostella vectensis]XP_032238191.1 5-hydrox
MDGNLTCNLSTNGSAGLLEGASSFSIALQVTFLALVILIAVVANGFVCLVIYKTPALHNVINMFLVSMSISDLLHAILKMSTTLVSTLYRDWYPHKAICYVTTPFGVLFGAASVFNLCAVAVNQYFVIVKPLHYPLLMTYTHARRVITALWLGSIVISTPPIFWRSAKTICRSGAVSQQDYISEVCYIGALWTFVIFIPSVVMTWAYSNIYVTARNQIKRMRLQNGVSGGITKTRKKELRVAALLALIGGIFIICWVPFFIVMTLVKFSDISVDREYFKIFLFVMYAKSAINPLLYTVMNYDLKLSCKRFLMRKRLAHRESMLLMRTYSDKSRVNGSNEEPSAV